MGSKARNKAHTVRTAFQIKLPNIRLVETLETFALENYQVLQARNSLIVSKAFRN